MSSVRKPLYAGVFLSVRFDGSDPGSSIAFGASVGTTWAANLRAELKILRINTKYEQNFLKINSN
jgi:hypothetical protein